MVIENMFKKLLLSIDGEKSSRNFNVVDFDNYCGNKYFLCIHLKR